jgi:DNA-binding NtrC family response regulator|tara:strand:+ start:312 stop:647 length:336 start_codon:yes stop_codon:yes gene_type:complete
MTELDQINQELSDYVLDLPQRSYYLRAMELIEISRKAGNTLYRSELELEQIIVENFYRISIAADMMGMGRSTLARRLNEGKIDGLRANGKWFVPKKFVDEQTGSEEWLNEF